MNPIFNFPKKILLIVFLLSNTHPTYAIEKISIMGLFKDKAIVQIDGKQRVLSKGKTSPEGVTLISANSRETVLEFNGTQQTFTIGSHIGSHFKKSTDQITVSIAPDSQGMYWVNGSINDFHYSVNP